METECGRAKGWGKTKTRSCHLRHTASVVQDGKVPETFPSARQREYLPVLSRKGFLGGSVVKNLPANTGDASLIPGSGRSPGEGNGNPLQYSCLENPVYGGAWRATVCGVAESQTRLSE